MLLLQPPTERVRRAGAAVGGKVLLALLSPRLVQVDLPLQKVEWKPFCRAPTHCVHIYHSGVCFCPVPPCTEAKKPLTLTISRDGDDLFIKEFFPCASIFSFD